MWAWFLDLFNPGGVGMGPFRPSFAEIEAYGRVTGVRVRTWEAFAIRNMAQEFIDWNDEKQATKTSQPAGMKKIVPMSDTQGLKALFASQGSKRPSKPAKRAAPE